MSNKSRIRYSELSQAELIALLERRDAAAGKEQRFGLVWERDEIEREEALNSDFVALQHLPELSSGAAPYENLIIEGDNFDALRFLRMTHAGAVKSIYIDPPYNTGNRDFVYNDRFVDREDAFRHSKWLEFMYRRLILARELLRDDGVIFVSIDDNEIFTLGMLMHQVFGEANFVANIVWQKRTSPDARVDLGPAHDYILVWAKDKEKAAFNTLDMDFTQSSSFKNPDSDSRGAWASTDFTAQGYRPNQMYEIITPSGQKYTPPPGRCWANVEPVFKALIADNRIWFGAKGSSRPRVKKFAKESQGIRSWSWWPHVDAGHNQEAKKEVIAILGTESGTIFSTPKPVRLIERILRIATNPGDLVVDFFAGSGTTAHAVLKLNAEEPEAAKRRFILVSNSEATTAEPEKNLCRDICARRVRRVCEGFSDFPPLGDGFAYLRAERVSAEELPALSPEQVWLAVALYHLGSLPENSAAAEGWYVALKGEQGVAYLPIVERNSATSLYRYLQSCEAEVTVYTHQVAALQQRLGMPEVEVLPVPATIASRFGMEVVP